MSAADFAAKMIPVGSLVLRASDSRLHLYRVCAWSEPSSGSSPVCLAYRRGRQVQISLPDLLPWQSR